jgi:hypothetical protein
VKAQAQGGAREPETNALLRCPSMMRSSAPPTTWGIARPPQDDHRQRPHARTVRRASRKPLGLRRRQDDWAGRNPARGSLDFPTRTRGCKA